MTVTPRRKNPTKAVHELDGWWADITAWTAHAERNLNDLQPGFPAHTPGSGDVGGGSGISDRTGNTAVRDAQAAFEDRAVRDLARLYEIAGTLAPLMREWRQLAVQYSYATPGELSEGRLRRTARPTESKTASLDWCHSCERVGQAAPTWKTRVVVKDEDPVPLCKFCYGIVQMHKVLPPLGILDAHHKGRRISEAAVRQAVKAQAPPEVHKPGKRHKANNEHPARPSVRRRGPGAQVPFTR